MSRVRFIVKFIPYEETEKVAAKHRLEIASGASVWDFVEPTDLASTREWRTEQEAWVSAKELLPLDEFGEVHVFEQTLVKFGQYDDWETTRWAVVTDLDTEFLWERQQ